MTNANEYEVRFTGRGRGTKAIKSTWVADMTEAKKACDENGGGLVFWEGRLVGNFGTIPTTGCPGYVVGLRARRPGTWR